MYCVRQNVQTQSLSRLQLSIDSHKYINTISALRTNAMVQVMTFINISY